MKKVSLFIVALACLVLSITCFADDQKEICGFNGSDYGKATVFFEKFRDVWVKDDRKELANFFDYPLRINKGPGKFYYINSKEDFMGQYRRILNKKMKKYFLNHMGIFCNYQGGTIASGMFYSGPQKLDQ